jgi:hypothetical protein
MFVHTTDGTTAPEQDQCDGTPSQYKKIRNINNPKQETEY